MPHAPQFCGSLPVSTHAPLHAVAPAWQLHFPAAQAWRAAQTVAHEPQWFGSLVASMHAPLQASSVPGQAQALF